MDSTFDRMFYPEGEMIAGVDESGVTDIAGPVVAACVILPKIDIHKHDLRIFEVADCKQVPEEFRKKHAEVIWETAIAIGIGEVCASEVDLLYKSNSAALAMTRAILSCKTTDRNRPIQPDFLIVDGERPVPLNIKQAPITNGDQKSLCVAAASIVAKVYRDNVMAELHRRYPYYGWNKNKGFPCKAHFAGLDQYGIQPGVHRIKRWPFTSGTINSAEPWSEKEKAEWKDRLEGWKLTTLRRLTEEVGGKEMWTTNPPLSTLSKSLSEPSPKNHRSSRNTKPAAKE